MSSAAEGRQSLGNYSIPWDGRDNNTIDVAADSYYYRIRVSDEEQTWGMIPIR